MRIGCIIATGIGGIETVETQHDVMRDRGAKMVSPLGIPLYMPNAGAAAVSMKHGLQGQMYGLVSACSGGAHAIGSALRMIQYGDADAVVAGGAEAALDGVRIRVLQLDAGVVSDRHVAAVRRPPRRVRDGRRRRRDGGSRKRGAARERGATILGEVIGYGSTRRRLPPDRARSPMVRRPREPLNWRSRDAGVTPAEVAYVNAHGTSTQLNDSAETARAEARPWRGSRQADPGVLD